MRHSVLDVCFTVDNFIYGEVTAPVGVLELLDRSAANHTSGSCTQNPLNPLLSSSYRVMDFHSPASTPSPETWESEEDEHVFGYPLQRMVPVESMQRCHEESSPLAGGPLAEALRGLYKMPTESSSTSSHVLFV